MRWAAWLAWNLQEGVPKNISPRIQSAVLFKGNVQGLGIPNGYPAANSDPKSPFFQEKLYVFNLQVYFGLLPKVILLMAEILHHLGCKKPRK